MRGAAPKAGRGRTGRMTRLTVRGRDCTKLFSDNVYVNVISVFVLNVVEQAGAGKRRAPRRFTIF